MVHQRRFVAVALAALLAAGAVLVVEALHRRRGRLDHAAGQEDQGYEPVHCITQKALERPAVSGSARKNGSTCTSRKS